MGSPYQLAKMALKVAHAGTRHLHKVQFGMVPRTLHGIGVYCDYITGFNIPKNKRNCIKKYGNDTITHFDSILLLVHVLAGLPETGKCTL